MRYYLHVPWLPGLNASRSAAFIARILTTAVVSACMLWLGARVYSAGANTMLGQPRQDRSPGVELAWASGAVDGQSIVTVGDVRINIESYNRKREKEIADKSRKLLSLAIALKSDLDQDPGSEPSADAVSKAKQIEKLAHDVKENMKLNIVGPQ